MRNCSICGADNSDSSVVCAKCGGSMGANPMSSRPLSTHTLLPGTKLCHGDYAIGKVLGQGGFGITYLGSDTKLKRPVAIKEFFLSGYCSRQGSAVHPITGMVAEADFAKSRDSFLSEGQKLARFHHRSIVAVHATFEENNTAYLVMEFLEGKSLQSYVDSRGALQVEEALCLFESIADAMEAVHSENMLHLDIKPDNIMVCKDGRAVLIDFGISKEYSANLTQTNPGYTEGFAPPEQSSRRSRSGPTNDVYSLGATLYCALTGQIPIPGTDRLLGVELDPPSKVSPAVPSGVSSAIMWAMKVKASERPHCVKDLRDAIQGSREAPPSIGTPSSQATVGSGPFRFASGDAAYTIEELVGLFDSNWEESKKHLKAGGISDWLYAMGRADLALLASDSLGKEKDLDQALESFIQSTKLLPPPEPTWKPSQVDFGRVEAGSSPRQLEMHVENAGRGHLAGTISTTDAALSVSPVSFSGNKVKITLALNPMGAASGKRYTSEVAVTGAFGQSRDLPVSYGITFPTSRLVRYVLIWTLLIGGISFLYRLSAIALNPAFAGWITWTTMNEVSATWKNCVWAVAWAIALGLAVFAASAQTAKSEKDNEQCCQAAMIAVVAGSIGIGIIGYALLFAVDWFLQAPLGFVRSPLIAWLITSAVTGAGAGFVGAGRATKRSDISRKAGWILAGFWLMLSVLSLIVSRPQ